MKFKKLKKYTNKKCNNKKNENIEIDSDLEQDNIKTFTPYAKPISYILKNGKILDVDVDGNGNTILSINDKLIDLKDIKNLMNAKDFNELKNEIEKNKPKASWIKEGKIPKNFDIAEWRKIFLK